MRQIITFLILCLLLCPLERLQADTEATLTQGDIAWSRRGEGHRGSQARPEPIAEAISAYSRVLETDPTDHQARWKLLRALYFQGEYVVDTAQAKLEVFQRGKKLADEGRRLLGSETGISEAIDTLEPERIAGHFVDHPQAKYIFFWSAVHWGLWGRHRGNIAAAREGVAKKIRTFAEITVLLDERFEEAGGHRILGRLHSEAPRLPFFTGWVDREVAFSELRRALELAPEALLTRLYLAEAILDHRPRERPEALRLLRDLVQRQPDPLYLVEETKTIEDAKALLAKLGNR